MDLFPEELILFLIFVMGLSLGSFVTALSWRIPRQISIFSHKKDPEITSSSRSFCPECKKVLRVIDLIPVLSWIAFKGRCRQCKTRISIRYPIIEMSTALLCVFFYLFVPNIKNSFELIILSMFLSVILISIIVIDLEHKIIPNILNLLVGLLGVLFIFLTYDDFLLSSSLQDAFVNSLIYSFFALLVRYAFFIFTKKDALGLGDVKFFAVAGVWLSLDHFPLFLFLSGVIGIVFGIIWLKLTNEKKFPFGPALILSFIVCLAVPEDIFLYYL